MSNKSADLYDFERFLSELDAFSFQNKKEKILEGQPSVLHSARVNQSREELTHEEKFALLRERAVMELGGPSTPLTKEEAETFNTELRNVKAELEMTISKLDLAQETLEKEIEKEGSFSISLNNRLATKAAAKRFFKENKTEITYEDYLLAREYKNAQYEKEVKSLAED